jgi:hypothetical protein
MLMMGDEETSNTTGPSPMGPSPTGPSPGPSTTPPPSYKPAVITNAPPTNEYRYATYESCSGQGDTTNQVIFTEKMDGAALNLDGIQEIKGVGYPEIGSMVVHNLSIKGSYKIGEKDYTIDEGVGHKLIKFCQDDGTKATKYDFVMEF